MEAIIDKIAHVLMGIEKRDLTTAEKHICSLLIATKLYRWRFDLQTNETTLICSEKDWFEKRFQTEKRQEQFCNRCPMSTDGDSDGQDFIDHQSGDYVSTRFVSSRQAKRLGMQLIKPLTIDG